MMMYSALQGTLAWSLCAARKVDIVVGKVARLLSHQRGEGGFLHGPSNAGGQIIVID